MNRSSRFEELNSDDGAYGDPFRVSGGVFLDLNSSFSQVVIVLTFEMLYLQIVVFALISDRCIDNRLTLDVDVNSAKPAVRFLKGLGWLYNLKKVN